MNQSSNLNEFVGIAQKKSPSFVIVAFNSAEVWSNTNILMDRYLSLFKPLKGIKTFHHTEIVNNKIHESLLSHGCPDHSSSANETKINQNSLSLSVVHLIKWYWGAFIFLKRVSNDQYIWNRKTLAQNEYQRTHDYLTHSIGNVGLATDEGHSLKLAPSEGGSRGNIES